MGQRWRKKYIEVKGQISRIINFVRQHRKTAKNVQMQTANGTQTIAPIKQTEKSLGPVGSVFLIIF